MLFIFLFGACSSKKYPSFSKNKNEWNGGYINTIDYYKRANKKDDFTDMTKNKNNEKEFSQNSTDSYGW